MQEVRQERTGWRDLGLNDRHRLWGFDCPAVDIDFLEYDEGLPVGLFEYKNEKVAANSESITLKDSRIRALSTFAECAGKPFFIVRYKSDYSKYHIKSGNTYARKIVSLEEYMKEADYVKFLYELRGRECPQTILTILDGLKKAA